MDVQCSLLPSVLSGLFPGDTILEVNGERVKYAPVEKVVDAITRVPPDSSEMSVRLYIEIKDFYVGYISSWARAWERG